jgi:hypothetical protein
VDGAVGHLDEAAALLAEDVSFGGLPVRRRDIHLCIFERSAMKYVLLLTRGEWQESGTSEEHAAVFGPIGEWFGKLRADGTIVEAHQLQPPATATTVVLDKGGSTLIDRPLLEAKEAIGGYAVIDVADLDAALDIARSFPVPDGKIEVRPVVER